MYKMCLYFHDLLWMITLDSWFTLVLQGPTKNMRKMKQGLKSSDILTTILKC